MIGVCDISLRDLVRFLYPANGDAFLRACDGQTYIYNNGAFTIFTGLFPEYLLSSCQCYAQCVDGAMWSICKRGGLHGRSDLDAMKALAGALAPIYRADVSDIDGVEGRKGKGESRRNDRLRSWIRALAVEGDMEDGEIEIAANISDDVVNQAFLHFEYDMWQEKLEKPT